MERTLFHNIPAGDERIAALKEHAASTTHDDVERALTDGQRSRYKERLNIIQYRDKEIEEHLTEYTTPLKNERKDIKTETRSIVQTLKDGFTKQEETVYLFPDFENSQMHYYNSDGDFIKSRDMRPEERQTSIVQMDTNRTGTDN